MGERWSLWLDSARTAAENMAVDEYLLSRAHENPPVLRVYGWCGRAVSIGYVQDYSAVESLAGEYSIVRRPTGGGIVHHDVDLTYTVVLPPDHPVCSLGRLESYRFFHRVIVYMMDGYGLEGQLAGEPAVSPDRATMRCFVSPTAYDVMCGTKKAAGAAQRRTKNGILHQGSIVLAPFNVSRKALAESLVVAFTEKLGIEFCNFTKDGQLENKIRKLADYKYGDTAWTKERDCAGSG